MKRRLIRFAVASTLGVAALAGCGDGMNTPDPSQSPAAPAGNAAAATAAPATAAATEPAAVSMSGRAHRSDGSPLKNVQIKLIEAGSGAGAAAPTLATTAEDGGYSFELKSASGAAHALYEVDYHGRHYSLWLEPLNLERGPQDPLTGARELRQEFILKVSGANPGARGDLRSPDSYHGGSIYLEGMLSNPATAMTIADGETVEITLAPDGPLIDGAAGKELKFHATYPITPENAYLLDIPIGRYTASAKLADGAPLRVASPNWIYTPIPPPTPPGPTTVIEFVPAKEDKRGKTEGVLSARLFITK